MWHIKLIEVISFITFYKGFLIKLFIHKYDMNATSCNIDFEFLPPRHIEHIAFIGLRKGLKPRTLVR